MSTDFLLSMATLVTLVNQTVPEVMFGVSLEKFNHDKKYKEKLVKEIIATISAMLNTNGGKVVINFDDGIVPSVSQKSSVVRIIDQRLITIIETNINRYVTFEKDKNPITVFVKKADTLITVNYNLCLPSETEVIQVPPSTPIDKVKEDFLNRKVVLEPVTHESHRKLFSKAKESGLSETKTIEFKNVKADASSRTTLADRMTGKGNKFSCYVSAFANYNGGHIYYGIDDDGVVVGEFIPSEKDICKITKKVENSINKMIWPVPLKRRKHWDIFFEPVLDDNSAPIPLTFVIVIFIAPCLGGVFTDVPECYEMVKGKYVVMSFTTWKERIPQPQIDLVHLPITDSAVKRSTWISSRTQRICNNADEKLVGIINQGKSIEWISNDLVKKNPELIEVQSLIIAKKVMRSFRSFSFREARELLGNYATLLGTVTERWLFDALQVYLEAAICTAEEDVGAVNNVLPAALVHAEAITPGRISAAIYLLAALNILSKKSNDDNLPVKYAFIALQHLKRVQDLPKIRADMEVKAHIIIAMFYLGCNRFAVPLKEEVERNLFEKAQSHIEVVDQSFYEGNRMSLYRELQFKLLQSTLLYRKSQLQPEKGIQLLEAAFGTSKAAEKRAIACNFQDIASCASECSALFTESLVRRNIQGLLVRRNRQGRFS